MRHDFPRLAVLLAALLLPALHPVRAADTPGAGAEDSDLAGARQAIEQKRWADASKMLERVVSREPRNADAHNLLGYALRWQDRMDESFAAYGRALKLDPNHRGAHEYIGMAYLKVGKPEMAEQHLAKLTQICGGNCEEARDLSAKLAEYKSAKK